MEDAYMHMNWEWDCQEEDQWKLAQFHSMLDLETRIACVHKEIARKRDEVLHFKCLLTKTNNERDEFQFKCKVLSKLLQHEAKMFEANASFVRATHTSYMEDNSIVKLVSSSIQKANQTSLHSESPPPSSMSPSHVFDNVVLRKRLPEKGKFLQAMIDAGPLLQTLLHVGALPQWQNAPPKLNAIKIPTTTNPLSSTTTRQMFLHQGSCVNSITRDSGSICKKQGLDRKL